MRRDLARACRRFGAVDFFGFDPTRRAPPSRLYAECSCGETDPRRARCPACGRTRERLNRYQVWQSVLVGAHLAEELDLDVGCSLKDAVGWRDAMRPYPGVARGLGWNAWCAFYAVTHLVYVLDDYSLYRLPRRLLEPERAFVRAVCRRGVAKNDPLVVEATDAILASQNRDGSWGLRGDVPYTRFHKTWVALDGLTRYGKRRVRSRYGQLTFDRSTS
jgi:hypothetical protein